MAKFETAPDYSSAQNAKDRKIIMTINELIKLCYYLYFSYSILTVNRVPKIGSRGILDFAILVVGRTVGLG